MKNIAKALWPIFPLWIVSIIPFASCDRQDEVYLLGQHRLSEEDDGEDEKDDGEKVAISLNLEEGDMKEEIEDLHYNAEEWEDKNMNVNL